MAMELLDERFLRQLPTFTQRLVDAIITEVPYYGMLPREVFDREIPQFIELNFQLFRRVLFEEQPPIEEELASILVAASRRAQEMVPLPALLAVYHVGARIGLELLRETATPDDHEWVIAASIQLQQHMQMLIPAVTAAYLAEQQALHSVASDARRALFDALVNGDPYAEAVERAGMTLPSSYSVLYLLLPGLGENTVVTRRRVHLIQDIVDDYAREPVLTSLGARGGMILLPAKGQEETLLAKFVAVAESPVVVGLSHAAAPEEVVVSAREAHELAVLARKLGRPPGLYRLSDLLVEYQLTRKGRAHDLLAATVAPLDEHPHLMEALTAYLGHEHARARAAQAIHVHPNTLDYRLRRVAELTGLDPAQPSAARVLAAALLAAKA